MKKISLQILILALTLLCVFCAFPVKADARTEPKPNDSQFVFAIERDAFSYSVWQPAEGDKDTGGVWVKMVANALGRSLIADKRASAGLPVGLYHDVHSILCRVQLPSAGVKGSLLMREQIYFDKEGQEIARWNSLQQHPAESPVQFVERDCVDFLYRYLSFSSSSNAEYAGGFCGFGWGTLPESINGLRRVGSASSGNSVDYEGEFDVRQILGDIPSAAPQRMTFSVSGGLVLGTILFEDRYYTALVERMSKRVGTAYIAANGVLRWFAGKDTVIEVSPILKEGVRRLTVAEYNWQLHKF